MTPKETPICRKYAQGQIFKDKELITKSRIYIEGYKSSRNIISVLYENAATNLFSTYPINHYYYLYTDIFV